jgi:tetratricopeptide (TPR) repeat protein
MGPTVETLRSATRAAHASAIAWHALGAALAVRREYAEAVEALRHACHLDPSDPHCACALGDALIMLDRADDAAGAYERAHAADPASAAICTRLGRLSMERFGDAEAAQTWLLRALAVARFGRDVPFEAYTGLCELQLRREFDPDAALARATALLGSLTPRGRLSHGLAQALEDRGRYVEARRYWKEPPSHIEALVRLTTNHLSTRELAAAEGYSLQALTAWPSNGIAISNHARFLQAIGRFAEARAFYRQHLRACDAPVEGPPLWGGDSVSGKTILLTCGADYGCGDVIQHIPAAMLLRQAGARVMVECAHRSILPLLRRVSAIDEVVLPFDPRPPCELQSGPNRAMALLDWTWDALQACVPYFTTPAFTSRPGPAGGEGRLKVGFHWTSRSTVRHDVYRFRSMPAAALQPLAALPGVVAYSLQVDLQPADPRPDGIVDLAGTIHDFSDTAAAVAAMDLVVAVDSSVAHVAGALGKSCLLLVPYAADQRWGMTAEPSDRMPGRWYPGMTLFRQPSPGDWVGVVSQVAREVEALARITESV